MKGKGGWGNAKWCEIGLLRKGMVLLKSMILFGESYNVINSSCSKEITCLKINWKLTIDNKNA